MLLGNPLPIADNPVRLAEELAMIDMISKGRLVSGFVRGGGVESIAANINPAFNRERFEEAHDLIIKTWTTPGPWRWEGEHYQFRVVNPWVLPLAAAPSADLDSRGFPAARPSCGRRTIAIRISRSTCRFEESNDGLEHLRPGRRSRGLPLGT